jgi:hypothetical protein
METIARRGHALRNTQFDAGSRGWYGRRSKNVVPKTRDEAKALLAGARTKRELAYYREQLGKFPDPAAKTNGRPTQRLAMGPVSKTGVRDERLEGSIPSPSAIRRPVSVTGRRTYLLALAVAAALSASTY